MDAVDGLIGGVGNDGQGTYFDGKDRVVAFTGSGDGFRFDTDSGGGRLKNDRDIYVDLSHAPSTVTAITGAVGLSDTDTRVNKTFTPINFCAMAVGESIDVVVGMSFRTLADEGYNLNYGCPWGQYPDPSSKMTVTKLSDTEWEFVGAKACLGVGLEDIHSSFDMPVRFTITSQ